MTSKRVPKNDGLILDESMIKILSLEKMIDFDQWWTEKQEEIKSTGEFLLQWPVDFEMISSSKLSSDDQLAMLKREQGFTLARATADPTARLSIAADNERLELLIREYGLCPAKLYEDKYSCAGQTSRVIKAIDWQKLSILEVHGFSLTKVGPYDVEEIIYDCENDDEKLRRLIKNHGLSISSLGNWSMRTLIMGRPISDAQLWLLLNNGLPLEKLDDEDITEISCGLSEENDGRLMLLCQYGLRL